jgi:hypothetical protein
LSPAAVRSLEVLLENVSIRGSTDVGSLVGWNEGAVSNVWVTGNVTGRGETGGLVGVNHGTISESRVEGTVTDVWGGSVGGLVGENFDTISNCHADAVVTSSSSYAGGLVASNYGIITESSAVGSVQGLSYVGGLVGYNNDGTIIDECYAAGNATGTETGIFSYTIVGGLVGLNRGSISNSYARGDVSGQEDIGGLVGSNGDVGSIINCYSTGRVTGSSYIGGLVGYSHPSGIITDSYWDASTSQQGQSAGGTGKNTAEMKQRATYENWDFAGVWGINGSDNDGYPFLRWQAYEAVPVVPSKPLNLTAMPGNGEVKISWSAPADDGGSSIIRYEVCKEGDADWTDVEFNTSYTFTGLTNGEEYTFKVRAVNSIGAGEEASVTATPVAEPVIAEPSTPRNLSIDAGDGEARLTWEAPASDGGSPILRYEVKKDDDTGWTDVGLSTGYTFINLTNGREYTFMVRAVNSAGAGPAVSIKATPEAEPVITEPEITEPVITEPGTPRNLSIIVGDEEARLTWIVPVSDGGSPILRYEVKKDDDAGWSDVGLTTGYTFINLTNGREYTFMVRAVNSKGEGPGTSIKATPATRPSIPQNVVAKPGDGQVTLSWEAPVNDGGNAIIHYEVYKKGDNNWTDAGLNTSYTFTGLTNGVEYTFFVSAVNGVGAGEWVQVKAAPEAPPKPTFTVTVNDSHAAASGAGSYAEGEIITINAGDRVNYNFSGWTSPDGVTFADAKSAATTFIMPAKNVTVIATWTYIEESEGGGPDTPSTPTYQANIISGTGTEETLQVSINGDIGTIVIEEEPWYGRPQDNVIIEIPPIPDVGTYSVDIPVQDLSRTDIQGTLTLNTEVGSITITSNMLEGIAETAEDKAQINIGQGDKSSLPEEVRDKVGDRPLIQLNLLIDGKQTQWSNPNAPVMVSIPYTPADEELANPEGIVVWYIDGAGNVVTIHNGRYDPETGMVTFYTTHFSDFAVVYNKASFNDVPEDAWYYKAVSFIAARGITQGTGNGNFSPASKLTRAECLVMMMRTYGIDPDTNPADNFSDAGDTYYTGYLAAAKRLGISSGVGNNMFAPGKEITRQEMFTMLYNTLKVIRQLPQGDSGKTLLDFSDASEIASWAEEAMTILVETGLIRGSGGMLAPTSTATRAEMAQLMYNLLIR